MKTDSEEKLSAFLAAALDMPGLAVTREGYSNGRVDLTIRVESTMFPEQRMAEVKIYAGPAYHEQAIEKLISATPLGDKAVAMWSSTSKTLESPTVPIPCRAYQRESAPIT